MAFILFVIILFILGIFFIPNIIEDRKLEKQVSLFKEQLLSGERFKTDVIALQLVMYILNSLTEVQKSNLKIHHKSVVSIDGAVLNITSLENITLELGELYSSKYYSYVDNSSIICSFDKSFKEQLSSVSKGDRVVIEGILVQNLDKFYLINCNLVS